MCTHTCPPVKRPSNSPPNTHAHGSEYTASSGSGGGGGDASNGGAAEVGATEAASGAANDINEASHEGDFEADALCFSITCRSSSGPYLKRERRNRNSICE